MTFIALGAAVVVAVVVALLLYAGRLDGRRQGRADRIRRRGGGEQAVRTRPDPAHPFDLEA